MTVGRSATVAPWLTSATPSHGLAASNRAAEAAARATCQHMLRAAALSGPRRTGKSKFQGNQIAHDSGAVRVLANRDKLAAFDRGGVIFKPQVGKMLGTGAKVAALHMP